MEPKTITITDETEFAGVLRARCFAQVGYIHNLGNDAELDGIIVAMDDAKAGPMQELLSHLETARAALEAIHGKKGGA